MEKLFFDRFPGGKCRALTMSYDDGVRQDQRLIEIFNAHKIRGTFHLNSGTLGKGERIQASDVAAIYAGHEVSAHGVMHFDLPHLSTAAIIAEVLEDRRNLERLVGYPVRGMSYAYGRYDDRVVAVLPTLGIEYARTTQYLPNFSVPSDFLRWASTCHHSDSLKKAEAFLALPERLGLQLFYVWGHSYEFDRANNWDLIERFCELMGGRADIWYATQIEIVDYINAIRAVRCSVDQTRLYNPSSQTVWFTRVSGPEPETLSLKPGEVLRLEPNAAPAP